eukprot:gene6134-4414_t
MIGRSHKTVRAHFSAHVSVQTKPWVRLGHNSNSEWSNKLCITHTSSSRPARATAAEYNPQAQTTHIYVYSEAVGEGRREEREEEKEARTKGVFLLQNNNNLDLEDNATLRQWQADPMRRGPQPRKVWTKNGCASRGRAEHTTPPPATTSAARSSSSIRSQTERYVSIERQLKHGFDHFITCQLLLPRRKQPPRTSLPQPGKEVATRYLSIKRAQRLQSVDVIIRQLRGRSSTVQVTVTGKPTADVSAQCVRHAARRESHAAKGEPGGAGAIYYVLVRWYIVSQGARRGTHAQLGRAKAKASSAPAARHTRYRSVLSLVRTGGSQPQTPPRISGLPQTHSAPAGNHRRKCGIIIGSPPPERAHFSAHVSVQTKPWVRLGHNSMWASARRAAGPPLVHQCRSLCITHTSSSRPARATAAEYNPQAQTTHIYVYSEAVYFSCKKQQQPRPRRQCHSAAVAGGSDAARPSAPKGDKCSEVVRSPSDKVWTKNGCASRGRAEHTTPPPATTSAARSSSSIRSQTERYVSIERQLKHGFDHFITCQLLLPRRKQPPRTSLPQPGKEVATRYLSIKRAQRLQSVDVIIRHTRAEGRATTGGTPPPPAPIQRALSGPTALGQLTPSTSKAAEARGRSSTVQVTVTGKPTADVSAQCVRHAARRESHAAKGEPGGAGAIYYVLVRWYIVSQGARRGTHAQLGRAKAKASSAPAARHTRYRSVLSLVRTGGSQPQTPPRISGLLRHTAHRLEIVDRRKCGIIIGSPPPERAHFSAHVSVQTKPWVRLGHNSNSEWSNKLCITHTSSSRPARATAAEYNPQAQTTHIYVYSEAARTKGVFLLQNNNNLDLEDNATLRQWQADPMRRGPQPRKVWTKNGCASRGRAEHTTPPPATTSAARSSSSIRSQTERYVSIERQLKHGFDHFITCQLLLPRRKQPPRTSLPQPGKEVATRYLSIKRAQRLQSVDVIIRHTRAEGRATTGGTPPPPAPIQRALSGPTALGQLTPSTSKAAEARGRSSTVQVTVTGKPTADVSAQCVRHAARRESHAAKGEPGGAGAIYYVLVRWYIVSQGARRGTHAQLGRAKAKASSAPAARHTRYRSVLSLVRTGGSQPQTPPRISGLPQTHSAPAGNHRRKCGIIIGSPPPERAHFSAHVSVQTKPWVRLGHNSNSEWSNKLCITHTSSSRPARATAAEYNPQAQTTHIYVYSEAVGEGEKRGEGGRKRGTHKRCISLAKQQQPRPRRQCHSAAVAGGSDAARPSAPKGDKCSEVVRSPSDKVWTKNGCASRGRAEHTTPPPATTSAARSSSSIRSQTERYVSIERQLKHGFDHFITCQLLLPRRKQPPRTSLPQPGKEVATRYLSIKRAQRLQSVDVIIRHTRAEGRATTGGTPPPPAPIQRALSGPTALGQLTPSTSKAAEARGRSSTVQVTVTGKPTADVSAQCVRHAARRESHAAKGEPGGAGAIYYVLVRWYIVSQGARRGTHAQLGRAKAKASSAPAARHTRYRSVLSLVRTGGSQPQTPPRISGLPQTHSAPAGNHRRKCGIIIGSPPPERAHFSAHVSVQTKPWVRLGHNSMWASARRAAGPPLVHQCRSLCITHTSSSRPARATAAEYNPQAQTTHIYIYSEAEEKRHAQRCISLAKQQQPRPRRQCHSAAVAGGSDAARPSAPKGDKCSEVVRSPSDKVWTKNGCASRGRAEHTTPPPATTSAARSSSSIRSQTERYVSIERQLKHGFDHFITCQLLLPRRKQPPRTSLPQPGKEVATRYLSIKRAQRLQSVDVIIRHTRAEGRATTGGTPPPPAPIQRALSGPTALGQLTPSTSKAAEARGRSSTVQVTVTGKPTADVSAQCVRHAARRESHAAKGEPGGAGAIYYVLVRWYIVSQGARRGTHAQLGRAKAKASSAPAARHTRYRSVLSLVRTGGSQPQTPPRISGLPQTHSAPAGNHRRKCGIIIGSPPPERAHFSAHVSVQTKPWVRLGHNSMWASARRAAGPPLVHQCRSLCITHTSSSRPARATAAEYNPQAQTTHIYIYSEAVGEERGEGGRKRGTHKGVFLLQNNNNLDLEDNATLRQWQADPMRRGPQPRKVINVQRSSGAHPIRFGPRTVVHHEAAPNTTPPPATTSAARSSSIRSQTERYVSIERQLKHGFDHFITCQLLLPRRKQPPRTSLPQPGKEVATRYLSIKRAQRLQSVDVIIRHTRAEGRATTGGTPPPPAPIQRALSGPTALGQLTPSTSKAAEARGRSSTVQVTVTGKPTADVSAQCPGGAGAIYYVLVRWYIVSQGARRGTHAQLGRAKAKASSAPAARHTIQECSLAGPDRRQPAPNPPRISGLPQTHSAPAGNHRRKCGIIIGSPPPERAHFSAHVSVQTKPWVRLGHNSMWASARRAGPPLVHQCRSLCITHTSSSRPARATAAEYNPQAPRIYIYIAKQCISLAKNNNLDLEDNATLRAVAGGSDAARPSAPKGLDQERLCITRPRRTHDTTSATTSAARSSSSIRSQTERYVSIERQLKHGFDHFITCQLLLPRRKQPPRTSLPQPGKEVATRYLSIKRAQRLQSVEHTGGGQGHDGRHTPTAGSHSEGPQEEEAARSGHSHGETHSGCECAVCQTRSAAKSHAAKGEPGGAGAIYYVLVRWYIVSQGRRGTHAQLGRAKAKASSAPAARHTIQECSLAGRTGGSQPQTHRASRDYLRHTAHRLEIVDRRKCGIIIGSPPPERAHFSAHVSVQTKPWVRLGHNSMWASARRAAGPPLVHQCRSLCITHTSSSRPARATAAEYNPQAQTTHIYIYSEAEEKRHAQRCISLAKNNNNLDLEDNATLRRWQADPMRRGPQPRKVINVQRSSGAHPIRFGPRTVVHHEAAPNTTPPPATTSAARSSSSIRSQTERYVSIERQLKHGFDHFITCQLLLPRRKQPPRTSCLSRGKNGLRDSSRLTSSSGSCGAKERQRTHIAEVEHTGGGQGHDGRHTHRRLPFRGPSRGRSSTVQVTVTGKPTADVSAQCVRHAARRESHAAKGEPGGAGAIYYVLVRWYIVSQGARRGTHARLLFRAGGTAHTIQECSLAGPDRRQPAPNPPRISGLPQTHSAPAGNRWCAASSSSTYIQSMIGRSHKTVVSVVSSSVVHRPSVRTSRPVSVQTKPWVRLGHNSNVGLGTPRSRATARASVQQQPAGARAAAEYNPQAQTTHIYIYSEAVGEGEKRGEGGRKEAHKGVFLLQKNNNNLDLEDNATLRRGRRIRCGAALSPERFGPRTVVHHEAAPTHDTTSRHHQRRTQQQQHQKSNRKISATAAQKAASSHLPASAGKEVATRYLSIKRAQRLQSVDVIIRQLRCKESASAAHIAEVEHTGGGQGHDGRHTPPPAPIQRALGRSSTVQVTVTGKPTADPGGAGAIYYVLVRWYIVSQGARRGTHAQLGRAKASLFRAGGTAHDTGVLSLVRTGGSQPQTPRISGLPQTHSAPAGNRWCAASSSSTYIQSMIGRSHKTVVSVVSSSVVHRPSVRTSRP